ncbi:hypothetical protein RBB50_000811 [Rhinocladiella similis]
MAEKLESYSATVRGGYSGKIKNNWAAADEQGWAAAKVQVFEDLNHEPGVAYVVVEGQQSKIQDHGTKYRYTGNFTREILSEQAHTDHDWKGHFKNWQGTRYYRFTLEIAVSTI